MNDDENTETVFPQSSVETFATAAGLLPEQLKGDKRHPVKLNRKTWQLTAALQCNGWTLDTQITQEEFDAAIHEVATVTAR